MKGKSTYYLHILLLWSRFGSFPWAGMDRKVGKLSALRLINNMRVASSPEENSPSKDMSKAIKQVI